MFIGAQKLCRVCESNITKQAYRSQGKTITYAWILDWSYVYWSICGRIDPSNARKDVTPLCADA